MSDTRIGDSVVADDLHRLEDWVQAPSTPQQTALRCRVGVEARLRCSWFDKLTTSGDVQAMSSRLALAPCRSS